MTYDWRNYLDRIAAGEDAEAVLEERSPAERSQFVTWFRQAGHYVADLAAYLEMDENALRERLAGILARWDAGGEGAGNA